MKTLRQSSAIGALALLALQASLYAQEGASIAAKTDAHHKATAVKAQTHAATAPHAAAPAAQAAPAAVTHSEPIQFDYPAATGVIACEDQVSVTITPDVKRANGFDIQMGKAHYAAVRVNTESGAIRIEDAKHGVVWLQMSNKSMLMNEKAGKRLANNCRTAEQIAAQTALDASTAPSALNSK